MVLAATLYKEFPVHPYTGLVNGVLCVIVWVMTFEEILALMREPGEDGLSPTIYDDLTASYNSAVDGGAAALSEQGAAHATATAELVAEIARLKALNFDLLMAAGSETSSTEQETSPESEDEPSIDSLFDKD